MPKRYRSKRPRRGRSVMKRRRARRELAPKMTVPGQIVPDKCLVTMPYFVSVDFNMYNASAANKIFRTSAWSPEYSLASTTGHQPLGYDQWANFYQNCRVIGVTGTIKFINDAAGERFYVGVLYTDDFSAVPATGSTAMWEQQRVKPRMLGNPEGGHDVVSIPVKWSAKQPLGYTSEQYRTSDSTFGTMASTSGSNPTIVSYMLALLWTTDGLIVANTTAKVQVMFDLRYHCECFGRRPLPGS